MKVLKCLSALVLMCCLTFTVAPIEVEAAAGDMFEEAVNVGQASPVVMSFRVTSEYEGNKTVEVYKDYGAAAIDTSTTGEIVIPSIVTNSETGAEYKVTRIGDYAFKDCTSLTSITIQEGVTNIGNYAFRNCTNLTSITLPNGLTHIGNNAFYTCTGLTSINIPDTVISIGNYAFYTCSGLTSVTIPEGVTSIESYAFCRSGLTSVTIPDTVTSIGDSAFRDCASLTSINIPDRVTSIGDSAFRDCTNLTSITIPDTVTNIGSNAFWRCTSLTSITIPESAVKIGYNIFYNCNSLESVYLEGSYYVGFSSIPTGTLYYYHKYYNDWQAYTGTKVCLFAVKSELTNITSNGTIFVPARGDSEALSATEDYSATLTATTGYALPEDIEITIDDTKLTNSEYKYTQSTGELTIDKNAITGNITIRAKAFVPPTIDTHPTGASYNQNNTATPLEISVTKGNVDGVLTYQWYSNDTNSIDGGIPITDEYDVTYTPSTTAEGTKYYYCIVTETVEEFEVTATSNIVEISVTVPMIRPTTTTDPTIIPTPTTVDSDTGIVTWKVDVTLNTQGSDAKAEIEQSELSEIVDNLLGEADKTQTSPQLELDVDVTEHTSSVELTLPTKSLNDLAENTGARLTVKSDIGTVTLDKTAIETILGEKESNNIPAANTITITIASADSSDLNEKQQEAVGDRPVYSLTVERDNEIVHDFEGGTATVTLPYELREDEDSGNILVFYVDAMGNIHRASTTYNIDTKSVIFTTTHFSEYMIAFEDMSPVEKFTDINAGDWYKTYVEFVYDNGVMQGMTEDQFAPNTTASRAMLWTVLARIESATLTEGTNPWYSDAQTWVIAQGISDGTDPEGTISREQFVTMLYRLEGEPEVTGEMHFTDANSISDYAKNAMIWGTQNRVITGYEDGTVNPQGTTTRAELSTMLQRYMYLGAF